MENCDKTLCEIRAFRDITKAQCKKTCDHCDDETITTNPPTTEIPATTSQNGVGTDTSIHSNTILVATPVINNAKEEYKQDIKNLYELESLGIKVDKDSDEEAVLQFMEKYRSTISIGNGRITAGFPFLDNVSKLKKKFNVAVKRLQTSIRLLQNDSEKMSL
ncbi:unnamed protein product [Cylicocyclus nassatus]|uniref:ShKT domain-containing protein n=1 Tax=Cylicocyclus nassatus TaxID=53992 RepID=A0AA36H4H2_CYLNA|nr:unnamed protein product [Cylicocyclus nassatus]